MDAQDTLIVKAQGNIYDVYSNILDNANDCGAILHIQGDMNKRSLSVLNLHNVDSKSSIWKFEGYNINVTIW